MREDHFTLLSETLQFLFVHIEARLLGSSRTEQPRRIRAAAAALASAARALGAPTTFAVTSSDADAMIEELRPFATDDRTFVAHAADAFINPAVGRAVSRSDRPVLVVCGYIAEVALLHTVLNALSQGYRVIVPVDATGSSSERTERVALAAMERAGADLTSAVSLLASLEPDFTSPEGQTILSLIQSVQQG